MAGKYLKKEQVGLMFKHNILTNDRYVNANEEQRLALWDFYLLSLYEVNKISKHQSNTWKYPKNI